MKQEIIDRLQYASGWQDDITGQHYELWHDPETDIEYWVPVTKNYQSHVPDTSTSTHRHSSVPKQGS